MKNNYSNRIKDLATTLILLIGLVATSQNIQFTFENAQNTNDGSFNYYEADVMIQTISGLADFKLGSGQLYFNYNTNAFGSNIVANSSFTVTAVYASGYFLGEVSGFTNFYDISTINDNSASRVSWAFSQGVSSGAMTEIISTTPKKLIHIKIKYVDVNQDASITFEGDEGLVTNCRDQFFTACGPFDSAATTLDCTNGVDEQNVNVQFNDAVFDNSGAVLSNEDFELLTGLSIYPNPTKDILYIKGDVNQLKSVNIYSITSQHLKEVKDDFKEINISSLTPAIYIIKLTTSETSASIKIVKE
jgi:hypothetical protein